jgi:hypothetical protein
MKYGPHKKLWRHKKLSEEYLKELSEGGACRRVRAIKYNRPHPCDLPELHATIGHGATEINYNFSTWEE